MTRRDPEIGNAARCWLDAVLYALTVRQFPDVWKLVRIARLKVQAADRDSKVAADKAWRCWLRGDPRSTLAHHPTQRAFLFVRLGLLAGLAVLLVSLKQRTRCLERMPLMARLSSPLSRCHSASYGLIAQPLCRSRTRLLLISKLLSGPPSGMRDSLMPMALAMVIAIPHLRSLWIRSGALR